MSKIHLVLIASFLISFSQSSFSQVTQKLSQEKFNNPESISKPLTWWHWINGNVTKEGIKKDLMDMKRVGIAGVQLFDTHMYLPKGPVRYGKDIWHEHVQYAIRMCDSLEMEFYITNSPGWSGAGGPWVTLDKSMKQLVYSETDLSRPVFKSISLSSPYTKLGFYKDAMVLAVPTEEDGETEIRSKLKNVVSSTSSIKDIYDEDYTTGVAYSFLKKNSPHILFEFTESVAVNTVNFDMKTGGKKIGFTGVIETSVDGVKFIEASKFDFSDHQSASANFTVSFAGTNLKFMRIRLDGSKDFGKDFQINEIKLRNLKNTTNWFKRTGMVKSPFLPQKLLTKENFKGISKEQVIDLTKYFDSATGNLVWKDKPSGKWTILRFGYTTTAKKIHPAVDEGSGYEIDKLDAEAVAFQFNQAQGRIIKEAGNLTGKTFKGILFDSFEGGFQNWTEKLPKEFLQRKGYDISTYLPVLTGRTIESGFISSAFLWDFQQTLSDMFAENYYQTMQRMAHKHGLIIFSETQGGPMSPANGNRFVDVPMNEFWTDGIERREKIIKQTVSVANVLGKNIIGAEAFTSKPEFGKWQNLPDNLKKIGDFAFSLGINKFIFHTYTHQPYDLEPGFTMGRYGTHFGRTNSWWEYAPEWGNYLGRSQYLLQQGRTVSDICYLFPRDIVYEFPSWVAKTPSGFNYDVIYPQYLADLKVNQKELHLSSRAKYRLMVLPNYPYMTIETLKQLKSLLQQGSTLVGPPPIAPPDLIGYTKGKQEFDELVKEIWGGLNGKTKTMKGYGKGKLYWGKSIENILKENAVEPDVVFQNASVDSLRYIHRTGDGFDIYFVSNQSSMTTASLNLSLRIKGKQPEIWDALTGKLWNVPVFDVVGDRTNIPVQIEPQGSVFVVFRNDVNGNYIKQITTASGSIRPLANLPKEVSLYQNKYLLETPKTLNLFYNNGKEERIDIRKNSSEVNINSPWLVKFVDGRGAPESITMNPLQLWNEYDTPGVRYYSGKAEYVNSFKISGKIQDKEVAMLELGEVYDIAEVLINGQSAGVIWKKPYRIDITPFIKTGKNDITIKVVNRWINRLIGDEHTPVDAKYDTSGSKFSAGKLIELPAWLTDKTVERKDKRYTFSTWKHYEKDSPLVKSGLLGDVKIKFYIQLYK